MSTTAPADRLEFIPIGDLKSHAENVRWKVKDVASMARSITEVGILEPLVVTGTPGDYTVVLGHRRLAGAKKAGLTTVPCIVRDDLRASADAITSMLVENLEREGLTPLEQATAYEKLELIGLTEVQIAERTGRPRREVTARKRLMRLPDTARDSLAAGQMTLDQAEALAQYADDEDAMKYLEPAIGTHNLNYRLQDWPHEKRRRQEAAKAKAEREKQAKADKAAHEAAVAKAKAEGTTPPPPPAPKAKAKAEESDYQRERREREQRDAAIVKVATPASEVRVPWVLNTLGELAKIKVTLKPQVRALLLAALRSQDEYSGLSDDVAKACGLTLPVDLSTLTDAQALVLLTAEISEVAAELTDAWDWTDRGDGARTLALLVELGYTPSDDEKRLAAGEIGAEQ